MPRFFTTDISSGFVRVTGGDARHMARSLRMREGEDFEVCDLAGSDYTCEITEISESLVQARILKKIPSRSEARVKISLFQALPKSDKLEQIAQKTVELGVFQIIPVMTSRCITRWDARDTAKKLERLQKIVLEAAKQSGRAIIPAVLSPRGFEAAIGDMLQSELSILFYEDAKTPLRERLRTTCDSISIMIGSEGGFSQDEALYAEQKGVKTALLGPRILRCETAPICAISAILYGMGEF